MNKKMMSSSVFRFFTFGGKAQWYRLRLFAVAEAQIFESFNVQNFHAVFGPAGEYAFLFEITDDSVHGHDVYAQQCGQLSLGERRFK